MRTKATMKQQLSMLGFREGRRATTIHPHDMAQEFADAVHDEALVRASSWEEVTGLVDRRLLLEDC